CNFEAFFASVRLLYACEHRGVLLLFIYTHRRPLVPSRARTTVVTLSSFSSGLTPRRGPGVDRGPCELSELLKAVALYAVGGVAAREGRKDIGSIKLIGQLK